MDNNLKFGEAAKASDTGDWGGPQPGSGPKQWAPYLRKLGYAPVPVETGEKFSRKLHPKFHNGMPDQDYKEIRFENFPALGTLTGNACDFGDGTGLLVIDVDDDVDKDGVVLKDGSAKMRALEMEFNDGQPFDTVKVRTPAGGLHYHFKCPRDKMPGNSSVWDADHINVKAQGGFVMLPPSPAVPPKVGDTKINRHEAYVFEPEPNGDNLMMIPLAMLEKIRAGGAGAANNVVPLNGPRVATPSPTGQTNDFGGIGGLIDGREVKMRDVAFAVVTNARRKNTVKPANPGALIHEAWTTYLAANPRTRIAGVPNEEGLEQEGRGRTYMNQKVEGYWNKWDTLIAEKAAERPKSSGDGASKASSKASGSTSGGGDGGGAAAEAQGAEDELSMVRASDLIAEAITWLWETRLALGKMTLLGGNPGGGKSQITINATACITTGGQWPDGGRAPLGSVIILSAEDGKSDTIVPRLIAAGANLERVHIVDAVDERENSRTGKPARKRTFSLQRDLESLAKAIKKIGDVSLVILDPVTSYMGGKIDSHRVTDVRDVLEPVGRFAEETGVAVLAITHPPKGAASAINSFTGSLAFVAVARVGLFAVEEPDSETGRRLLLGVKSNIGKLPAGLGYHVEGVEIKNANDQSIETSKVVWDGKEVTVTASEAIRAAANPGNSSKLEEAKEFLRGRLAEGPQTVDGLFEVAAKEGISEPTLKRARLKMGVVSLKTGYQGQWQWSLPEAE